MFNMSLHFHNSTYVTKYRGGEKNKNKKKQTIGLSLSWHVLLYPN